MHISFRASTLHKPIAPPNLPATPATSSPVTTGSDFRDSLPRLAFAGISFKRNSELENPELNAAFTYVLNRKIKDLIPQISNQLGEQDVGLREKNLGFYARAEISPYFIFVYKTKMFPKGDYRGLAAENIQTLIASLAEGALEKYPPETPGLSPKNAFLAAKYGCLLLMGQPGFTHLIQQSEPYGGHLGGYIKKLGFRKANDTKIYGLVIDASKSVQNWLNVWADQILNLKKEHDNLEKLKLKHLRLDNRTHTVTLG